MQPRLTNCHLPCRTNAPPLWGVVDYWTVLSTLVQFIHEVTHKKRLCLSDVFAAAAVVDAEAP